MLVFVCYRVSIVQKPQALNIACFFHNHFTYRTIEHQVMNAKPNDNVELLAKFLDYIIHKVSHLSCEFPALANFAGLPRKSQSLEAETSPYRRIDKDLGNSLVI